MLNTFLTLWPFVSYLTQFIILIFDLKWGWKSEKSNIWSGNSATIGKKSAARGNKQESIPDPLLSPFICNVPIPNCNSINPDENSSPSNKDIDIHNAKRYGSFTIEIL